MAAEKPSPRPELVWLPHHDVVEGVRFQDRQRSISQLLQLRPQLHLPWYQKQLRPIFEDVAVSPHKPLSHAELVALVGSDDTQWIDGIFHTSGDDGVGTGIGWNFELSPKGYEVEFMGVLIESTPGHVVISGRNSFHIDATTIDGHVEDTFRKALEEAVKFKFGSHRISSLNLNTEINVRQGLPSEHAFE